MFAQRFDENYRFKPFLMKYKDTMDSIAKGMVLGFIFELYLTEIPFYYAFLFETDLTRPEHT